MHIALNQNKRRLRINGVDVKPPRAVWTLPVLDALLQSDGAEVSLQHLESRLAAQGLRGRLTARQMVRVWAGLEALFASAGLKDGLHARLRHGPRARTAGPWRWIVQPQDGIELDGGAAAADPRGPSALGFAIQPGGAAAWPLFMALEEVMALLWKGLPQAALAVLSDHSRWAGASAPLRALVQLRRGESLGRLRRFDEAWPAFDAARQALRDSPAALAFLHSHVDIAEARQRYAELPEANYPALLLQMQALRRHPAPPGDPSAAGEALNLEGLCLRRHLEAAGAELPMPERRALLAQLESVTLASLFLCMAVQQHERAQCVCANLGYAYQRVAPLIEPALNSLSMRWHLASSRIHGDFDLAFNSAWEYIFIGELWLDSPSGRASIAQLPRGDHWQGDRPDELRFYESAVKVARDTDDPRQQAHAWLNLYRFAVMRRLVMVRERALAGLAAVLAAEPRLGALLRGEGYKLPRVSTSVGAAAA